MRTVQNTLNFLLLLWATSSTAELAYDLGSAETPTTRVELKAGYERKVSRCDVIIVVTNISKYDIWVRKSGVMPLGSISLTNAKGVHFPSHNKGATIFWIP